MTDREHAVCFTGHRHLTDADRDRIRARLPGLLNRLIAEGITDFVAGGALGFDTLMAKTVLSARKKEPRLKLILFLPCPEQAAKWTPAEQAEYENIKAQADEVYYTADRYTSSCMLDRNRQMVDHSRVCIAFYKESHARSGTGSTVRYAARQGVPVYNLAAE